MFDSIEIQHAPAKPRFAGTLSTVRAAIAIWRLRNRTRRQLAALDAYDLADLGLSSAQQGAEAAKWFWQP